MNLFKVKNHILNGSFLSAAGTILTCIEKLVSDSDGVELKFISTTYSEVT